MAEVKVDEDSKVEVDDFDWPTYLEVCKLEATPESSFCHVEASLDSGVKEGMIVEKPLDSTENVFWLASIDSVFGPLLKLSWLGDENLQEIWLDLTKERVYPLGYCQMNRLKLEPPKRVAEMCPLWETLALQYLEDATFDTVSMHFLDDDGITPIERIKSGMAVQVLKGKDQFYEGKILSNFGGLLHVQDVDDKSQEEYIFYNSPRIFPPKTNNPRPPPDLIKKTKKHQFSLVKDQEVEVLIEGKPYLGIIENGSQVRIPATSTVINYFHYNLAQAGTFLTQVEWKNPASSAQFPTLSTSQELGYEKGQKLLLLIKMEFHPCTILSISGHFVRLNIDTLNDEFITSVHNPILFPLSWCHTQGLKFHIMKSFQDAIEIKSSTPDAKIKEEIIQKTDNENLKGSWLASPIYFNYKCYSASFLSRARLAGLPKKVGPGPVHLVMREVLNLIIGSSFKSGSVLKRLEAKRDQAGADFVIEELKGKSRVLNLKAKIEIPTKVHQVEKYLRETCQKLSACPNLVSTTIYDDVCPVDCHNKPKADFKEEDSSNQGNNGKAEPKLPPRRKGKKRKHPDALLVENSKMNGTSSEESETSSRPSSPCPTRKKRSKEWGTILPKSEIRTRGAKLPNFSLHLKIRPSRKEQRAIENANFRSNMYNGGDQLLNKSGGKKGRRELPPAFSLHDFPKAPPPIRKLRLERNPELWTPQDTAKFLAQTPDCAHLARFAVEDDIDGPAFMLLNYPTIKEYWKLKSSTAISLCRHIESVVLAHRLAF